MKKIDFLYDLFVNIYHAVYLTFFADRETELYSARHYLPHHEDESDDLVEYHV